MSERRILLLLLLLAIAAAAYVWGWPGGEREPKSREKTEADERKKANPFPE